MFTPLKSSGWAAFRAVFALFLCAVPLGRAAESLPFRDPALPLEQRITDLMGRLTLEEKAIVLNHRGTTITRLGIRADQWNQCLNGVKWDRPTTLFPTCIGMSATWNTGLVHEIATVLSDEARAIYNGWRRDPNFPGEHKGLIYRAPVINIGRNPYWGRNHEAWGEDPFLTGRMAVTYVRGLQGDDPRHLKLASTLKHYAVNNVETDRQKLNAVVSERILREYWLPHFRDAVVEGGAQSLMASYNALNGTPNNINRWLLTDVLKKEWAHEGFVVSDLGGVRTMVQGHAGGKMTFEDAVAQSVMAGCDFSDREYELNIPGAVRAGKLSEERLNDAVRRVLRVRFRLGEFDPFESVVFSRISPEVIGSAPHRAVALRAARESIVLLQNRGSLLPLDKARIKSIAVLGPLADQVVLNNYSGKAGQTVNSLQGITARAAADTEILHARGCAVAGGGAVPTKLDRETGFSGGASLKLEAEAPGDYIQFPVAIPAAGNYEMRLLYKSFPERGIFQLAIDGVNQGDPVDMYAGAGEYGQSANLGRKEFAVPGVKQFRFTVLRKHVQSGGFSGHFDRLAFTGAAELGVELETLKAVTGGAGGEAQTIAQAAALAKRAEVAVVFVGTTAAVEHEGRDRQSLGLSGRQEELVKAVRAANPRTVVVEMSAGPLTVPWIKENVPALLQAWWPGEEGGRAIAEVLFGEVNPAGRLPHTVYASESQVPPQDEYDIAKGFTYMHLKGEPLFAFGYGLSYTQFKYTGLKISPARVPANGSVTISATIENTGRRAGDEVPQLYVRTMGSKVARPKHELRGFQRVTLQPGEKRAITFSLPAEKLGYWDEALRRLVVEPVTYEVQVGTSAGDIRLTGRFNIQPGR